MGKWKIPYFMKPVSLAHLWETAFTFALSRERIVGVCYLGLFISFSMFFSALQKCYIFSGIIEYFRDPRLSLGLKLRIAFSTYQQN